MERENLQNGLVGVWSPGLSIPDPLTNSERPQRPQSAPETCNGTMLLPTYQKVVNIAQMEVLSIVKGNLLEFIQYTGNTELLSIYS